MEVKMEKIKTQTRKKRTIQERKRDETFQLHFTPSIYSYLPDVLSLCVCVCTCTRLRMSAYV